MMTDKEAEDRAVRRLRGEVIAPESGDIRAVGHHDAEKFNGKDWRLWCPCMDSGLTYCGWT